MISGKSAISGVRALLMRTMAQCIYIYSTSHLRYVILKAAANLLLKKACKRSSPSRVNIMQQQRHAAAVFQPPALRRHYVNGL
eukprot:15268-Heterococcus_DN1.PRE.2